jgi:choline-sulfatase
MQFGIRETYAAYYGNVTWVDEQVGKIIAALEEAGLREDTLVVFTSDHGDNLGSHGRCGKGLPFDESLRVPMIYNQPGSVDPGVQSEGTAGLIDIAPTFLAAAGLETPSHMTGQDVIGQGGADHQIVEIMPGEIAVRSDRYTAYRRGQAGARQCALYDNEGDPLQMSESDFQDEQHTDGKKLFEVIETFDEGTPIKPQPDYKFKAGTN